ncbi:hypothetical protein JZ751_009447 [Albula glossodonta]|uniref:Uncharacterized protein n=1 Tax=Albula glossodonta TaxID=121402 RepID=A0A8T2P8E6_9TELE|nr:hypothetical protein JZ751_009447 [Albula glossodonta]
MQSIYYTAPLLLFEVLLDYVILHTDAKEQLQKPYINVQHDDQTLYIACSTKLSRGTNITCNLYTGDAPEPYRRTWTKSGISLVSSKSSKPVTKPVPQPTRKTKKAKKKPTPLPQTTEIATAKSSTLTAVTTSSPDQYFTKPTPPPSKTKKAENLLVIIGPAVGVALLGVTAVCLCRRHSE